VRLDNFTSCTTGTDFQAFTGSAIKVAKLPNMTVCPNYVLRIQAVIFGDKVTRIGRYCINSSASGRRLVIMSANPPSVLSGTKITNPTAGTHIYVPDESFDDYYASPVFADVKGYLRHISEYPYPEELVFE